MDVAQLKTMIHVSELGSLSKAAERLGLVQPALSRQIRLLEEELGTRLFDRHGRGMTPTRVGREVLDHAERVLAEIEALRRCAREDQQSLRGIVTIGITPTVASIVTVPLVTEIRRQHPQLAIRFASAFSGYLIDWIQRGELEIAIAYDSLPSKTVRTEPVMIENLMLVSSKRRQSASRTIRFRDLASEKLILPSSRHGLRATIDDCATQAGITFDSSLEADSFQAIIDLVLAGFGSTILPLPPIYQLLSRGDLNAVSLSDPSPTRTVVTAYAADRPVSRAAHFVAATFRDVADELVAKHVWAGKMLPRLGKP